MPINGGNITNPQVRMSDGTLVNINTVTVVESDGTSSVVFTRTVTPVTYSGNITYTTVNNVSHNITPTSYTNLQAGAEIAWSGTLFAATGYQFNDGATQRNVSGTTNVPEGGGNININFFGQTVTLITTPIFSGDITYNVAANVTANINPTSYTGREAGTVIGYSGSLIADDGFEFSNGLQITSASGNVVVPNGGGEITVDLTGVTVTETVPTYSGTVTYLTAPNVTASISPTSYTNLEAGTILNYSGSLIAADGYRFSNGLAILTATGSTLIPENGGDIEFDLTANTVTLATPTLAVFIDVAGDPNNTPFENIDYEAVISGTASGAITYDWSISQNTSGADIVGRNDESTVTVRASQPGTYRLNLSVTREGITQTDSFLTTIT